ncbi:MAG: site-specific DNA-methyltransferase [Candidatus Edwardsbacteria bacterium]|nr:site-specific DNA-methyltransferase [Candidatus Edwardsbacteria bacterium]
MSENKEILKLKKEIDRLKKSIKKQQFGLVWMDIPEAFEDDVENKLPILKEVPDLAIKNDDGKPTHILIEGDNYHALTCLNYTHKGKIDVIYIDPPYNTGTDGFKYKDKRIITKFPDGTDVPKDHPLRHSYWLSFMRKRLELAYNLLKETGVMFISIDDNEVSYLKLLCDIIFQSANVELYIWDVKDESEGAMPKTAKHTVRKEHEYLICCFINKAKIKFNRYLEYTYSNKEDWSNPDKDPRGDWMSGNISRGENGKPGSNYYTIKSPTGKKYIRNWAISEIEYNDLANDNRIHFSKKGDGVPRIKIFKNESKPVTQSSIFRGLKSSLSGKNRIIDILGKCDFDHPKPVELIKRIIEISARDNATILDYFAGTGTTGDSTLNLNNANNNHKFILITNNENNICSGVCYPRVKKVMTGYRDKKNNKIEGFGNSLKYYKTDFIGGNNILNASDSDKVELAHNAGVLLSIAENTLETLKQTKYYQLFEDNLKTTYTAIYFREELDHFDKFVELVEKLNKKTIVYVFSWGADEFVEEFEHLSNVKIKSIPNPILEIYKNIYNLN